MPAYFLVDHYSKILYFLTKKVNAWVLIFCIESLEIAFLSFLIANIFWGRGMPPDHPRGKGVEGLFDNSDGC